MAQLSNQEIASLKNLLEKDMDRIEARLDAIEKETASIRTELKQVKRELKQVKRELINILGLDEEEQPTSQKRRTTSNPVSRSSRRERIPS